VCVCVCADILQIWGKYGKQTDRHQPDT